MNTLPEKENVVRALKGWQWVRKNHGSLYDRGMADSYYRRGPGPHYGGVGGDSGEKVTDLTQEEKTEYLEGYRENERLGDHKDYG